MTASAPPGSTTHARLDARLSGAGAAARIEAAELDAMLRETGRPREELVLQALDWARRWARAPISNFEVGAVALGDSGRLYLGANMEFDGLPLSHTVHAEQAVVAHAWALGEARLELLATSAAPCGFCRQFLLELPEPRPQLLLGDGPPTRLEALLPSAFGPTELGREPQLLCAGPHELRLASDAPTSDPLVQLACEGARRASAPYSHAHAAVALELDDGSRFVGAVAESVAYNPSLAPMQAALIAAHHGGGSLARITRAVLVERRGASVSQLDDARLVLASVAAPAILERAELV